MNISEIINRPNDYPIDQDEAYFIIQEYVRHRKSVKINPYIDTRFGKIGAMREVELMHLMLNYAISWFKQNPESWKRK